MALDALRELCRGAAFPLQMFLYFLHRREWRSRTREALRAGPPEPGNQIPTFGTGYPPRSAEHAHVFISAGEASGETHATSLMQAVRNSGLTPRWSCFGGPAMQRAGGELLYPLVRHAVMGFGSALAEIPVLIRAHQRYRRLLREDPPDLVVLVDYPGMHLVMAGAAHRMGIPVIHYIAPQYWGWAPWRVGRYRRCVDVTLTILPFEPHWFQGIGVHADYVGHPVLDLVAADQEKQTPRSAKGREPCLCLLPGSRRNEIEVTLPGMLAVARKLHDREPRLQVVVAHRDPGRALLIRQILQREKADFVTFEPGAVGPWISNARLVLAKSGTGCLEAVLRGTPTVVVYRMRGPLWQLLVRLYFDAPWFAAPNLIANREVVPEFALFGERAWQDVGEAVMALWQDGPKRQDCLQGIAEVRRRLGETGASAHAARWVRARFDGAQLEKTEPS